MFAKIDFKGFQKPVSRDPSGQRIRSITTSKIYSDSVFHAEQEYILIVPNRSIIGSQNSILQKMAENWVFQKPLVFGIFRLQRGI